MVNYTPLTKAQALAALYNGSRPQGMGFLQYNSTPMTVEIAQAIIDSKQLYFDYLNGRVMKLSLESDDNQFEERLYDRDNGYGAAQRIISAAIKENSTNPEEAKATHADGLEKAAEYTRKMAKQRTSISKASGGPFPGMVTFTLGVSPSEEELLNKAVDKALKANE